MQDSFDHHVQQTATQTWTNHCSKDNEQKQGLFSVRQLRSKSTTPLPCEPTPASVEQFLQCDAGTILHVERQQNNARGKQRYLVQFSSAERAAAAYAKFRDSSKAAQAVLVLKRTRLQNALVDLAIKLQHVAREDCGFTEVTVQSRGTAILVKQGAAEPMPYPFLQHMFAGHPPRPGQPFHSMTAAKVGPVLSKLLGQTASHPQRAPPPPPNSSSTQAAATVTRSPNFPTAPAARASVARTPDKHPSPRTQSTRFTAATTARDTSPTKHRPAAAPSNTPFLARVVAGNTPAKRKAEALNFSPNNTPHTEPTTNEQATKEGQQATSAYPPDDEQIRLETQQQPTTTRGRGRGRAVRSMYVGYCGGYGVGYGASFGPSYGGFGPR